MQTSCARRQRGRDRMRRSKRADSRVCCAMCAGSAHSGAALLRTRRQRAEDPFGYRIHRSACTAAENSCRAAVAVRVSVLRRFGRCRQVRHASAINTDLHRLSLTNPVVPVSPNAWRSIFMPSLQRHLHACGIVPLEIAMIRILARSLPLCCCRPALPIRLRRCSLSTVLSPASAI